MHLRYNVRYPYPNRRLKGVLSVQAKGKLFCLHGYEKTGFHEATVLCRDKEPVRTSIRHYKCVKCGRVVFVSGRMDDRCIEKSFEKNEKD